MVNPRLDDIQPTMINMTVMRNDLLMDGRGSNRFRIGGWRWSILGLGLRLLPPDDHFIFLSSPVVVMPYQDILFLLTAIS